MIQEETKNYIDDQVRLSTDSSIKAVSQVLGYLQQSNQEIKKTLEDHKENEIASREKAKEEMKVVVEVQMKKIVNGKLDKQDVKIDEILKQLAEMKQMKKDYDDKQGFKIVVKKGVLYILGLASLITAWFTIKSTIE